VKDFWAAVSGGVEPTGDTHAVDIAYEALCATSPEPLTREQATERLENWDWQPPLGGRERKALLARFSV
jgi:hypothetical protein